jgi:uncharacterized protein involved in response to NO
MHRLTPPPAPKTRLAGPQVGAWALHRLLGAPHKLAFGAAALWLGLGALWWAAVLALGGAGAGTHLGWALPPPLAHSLIFTLAFMPLFITGFLFTAGPHWLGLPAVPARALLAPVLLMSAGWALALPGVHLGTPLAATGLACVALGWSAVVWRWLQLLRASRAADRLHARLAALHSALGACALWAASAALAAEHVVGLQMAVRGALWGWLVPMFLMVSQRMLPFFHAGRPHIARADHARALLWVLLGACAWQLGFALAELRWQPLPPQWRAVQAAGEAPAAALLLWLALRWALGHGLRLQLLSMLHLAFAWLGVALALAAVSHGWQALSGGGRALGLAPLHALTMGYLGGTLMAMTTRVVAGHSGRAVAADATAWVLFGLAQGAALLRVVAALWPAARMPGWPDAAGALTLASSALWTAAMVGWAWRYGRWLGRPRADGRPE